MASDNVALVQVGDIVMINGHRLTVSAVPDFRLGRLVRLTDGINLFDVPAAILPQPEPRSGVGWRSDDPLVVLKFLRGSECETFTTGLGSCFRYGRDPEAKEGADRCCASCVADAALNRVAGARNDPTAGAVPMSDEALAAGHVADMAAAADLARRSERERIVAQVRLLQSKQPDGTSAYLVLASVLRAIERGEHLGD